MKTVAELKTEIEEVEIERRASAARLTALRRELGEAMVREAPTHPWLGKRVQRSVTTYRKTRTQLGIVAQNTATAALYGRRGHHPEPGEIFVKSLSGMTFYRMKAMRDETEWGLEK